MDSARATLLPRTWRAGRLLACHAAALAILASWLWTPTRAMWDAIDADVFGVLNGSLSGHGAWARAMALANMRAADALVAIAMLATVLRGGWIFERSRVRAALYALLAMLALLLAIRAGPFAEAARELHWQRSSPSLTVQGAVRLSREFPEWHRAGHIKDSSSRSFPGDHASVVFVWAAFLWIYASGAKRALIAALCALFLLPRLVGGAHWASDVLVGGTVLALLALGWGLATPYAAWAAAWLERITSPLLRAAARLPILRRTSLFAGIIGR